MSLLLSMSLLAAAIFHSGPERYSHRRRAVNMKNAGGNSTQHVFTFRILCMVSATLSKVVSIIRNV
jgi:hypothetical protein